MHIARSLPLTWRTTASLLAVAATTLAAPAHAKGDLKVSESVTLTAPVDKVWALVAPFDGLVTWHPVVASSALDKGQNDQVGAQRTVVTKDGAKLVETLTAFKAKSHELSYRIESSPLPVTDYVSTLKVERSGKGSKVTWSSHFKRLASAPDVDDAKARAIVSGIYTAGFSGLRANLGEASAK